MLSIPTVQRIESMYSCLRAIRAWYDVFFAIPLEAFAGYPFPFFTPFSNVQVALYRLTTTEDPAWDKEVLRDTANLLQLLDQTIERFNKMETVYPLKSSQGEDIIFIKVAKMMKNVRAQWEPVLSRYLGGVPTSNSQNGLVMGRREETPRTTQTPIPLPDPSMIDFGDMAWMTDVFGPWEY